MNNKLALGSCLAVNAVLTTIRPVLWFCSRMFPHKVLTKSTLNAGDGYLRAESRILIKGWLIIVGNFNLKKIGNNIVSAAARFARLTKIICRAYS